MDHTMTISKIYRRKFDELNKIFGFIESFYTEIDSDSGILHNLELTVEELFTNMVKYNPSGPKTVTLTFTKEPGFISVQFIDRQKQSFDPTKTKDVDLNAYISELRSGGLGIHLVKHMMDDFSYEYQDETSIITITKKY